MKQRHAVIVLFALIISSSLTSLGSYSFTSRLVNEDMDRALALTLEQQQSDVISQDTIRTFNYHLQIAELRGKATLAVGTRQKDFKCEAKCSVATIFAMSDQRFASALWMITIVWAAFCFYRRRRITPLMVGVTHYGGLCFSESEDRFIDTSGNPVKLTPMQHQLMEMFFQSPSHSLTKTEICDALWPKKPDASETLYTLIRRLKPVIEEHSDLKIESDRGRAYRLKAR
ncbi:MAG: helix-turn-helix domain-containing protein [Prevotella sp.]|nr:helix-turn-helix domain-containing protein [Prevotella sp.]